ncbi:Rv3235 family protein [Intrasporangium sp.]|uniref:Rv3235 family protein n=1 Tax=Intrasporangium sp. TaxID=1925024 RepID=UPI00293A108A|nr:Rv3235 family protein [Intrasporangium sp.]MDV3220043.1 Rv3235 family protein [Intrasporangium sp.]
MTADSARDSSRGEVAPRLSTAFSVRRIPDTAPRPISADDAWSIESAPYTQQALALDFFPAVEDEFARRPTRSSDLPEPEPFVAKIAQAVVEVITGQRPATQLIRHTSPTVYSLLARRALVSTRRLGNGARRRAVVRRIRLCEPADGTVEACAVVIAHGRVRALAFRLEGLDGRWLMTQVAIG